MIIELDDNDIRVASHVAFDRGLTSVLAGARNVNGGMDDPFLRHVIGALGEVAVRSPLDRQLASPVIRRQLVES